MQISNRTAPLVLMLRLPLAQPFLPLFPPSYPLPNRICRILESHFLRRQECQNTRPAACCLLRHAPYITSNLQEKVLNVRLMQPFNFHLVCGNNFLCKMHECAGRIADSHWLTAEIRLSATPPCLSLTRCADDLKRSFTLFMENRTEVFTYDKHINF